VNIDYILGLSDGVGFHWAIKRNIMSL